MKFGVITLVGLMAAAGLFGTLGSRAADPAKEEARDAILMRAKLAAAQQTLEGIMYGDFELIERGARQLHDIDEWRSAKRDAVYDHYSAEFRRLSEKLIRLANDKNAEGAFYTYQHLTSTCVTCHEYVRDVTPTTKRAELNRIPLGGGDGLILPLSAGR
jgi:hypothetical protein